MLLALALVIGTASLFAANVDPNVPKSEIRTQIVKLLDAPNFKVEKDLKVDITFTFSSEGEIVVLSVDSNRKDVLNYVRENLNYKKIQNPGDRDKLYTMPLTLSKV